MDDKDALVAIAVAYIKNWEHLYKIYESDPKSAVGHWRDIVCDWESKVEEGMLLEAKAVGVLGASEMPFDGNKVHLLAKGDVVMYLGDFDILTSEHPATRDPFATWWGDCSFKVLAKDRVHRVTFLIQCPEAPASDRQIRAIHPADLFDVVDTSR